MEMIKKIGYGYKLFEMNEDGELFPLFIGKAKETPMHEWIPAENLPTKGYSARPGWHCSMSIPDAPHLRGYDGSKLGPYKSRFKNGRRVWAIVMYDATNDYREEVKKLPKKCFTDRLPENGFYYFNEQNRSQWIITSAIKVAKILTEEERQQILKDMGYDEVKAYAKYKTAFEKRNQSI